MRRLLYLGFLFICLISSCAERGTTNVFDRAERYMEIYPDSALLLLNRIPYPEKLRGQQSATYALLLTQARDKNYLDSIQSDSLIKLAVDYYKNRGDKVKAGKSFFYYGKIMALQDRDTLAIQAYLNALAELENTAEYRMLALIYEYVGRIYTNRSMYEVALSNYHQSLCFYEKAYDTLGIMCTYRDIARIYSVRNDFANVCEFVNRGFSIYELCKGNAAIERVIPSFYHILGVTQRDKGNYDQAIDFLKTALRLEKNINSSLHCLLSLGDVYLHIKKYDEAKSCFEKVLASKRIHTQAGAFHHLYLLEKQRENDTEALYYKEMSDSLLAISQDNNLKTRIVVLQRNFESDKLSLEKQQLELDKQLQFYIGIAMMLLILLIGVIGYICMKKRYEERDHQNIRIIMENEKKIKQYLCDLDFLVQKEGEMLEKNKIEVGNLNQKIVLLESENRKIRENVCVNGVYLLDQLKKYNLIVKNMNRQEKGQVLEYIDLISCSFISRLKVEFGLTESNLMLLGLMKLGFTTDDLIFTFDCEMNSIFKKKKRLKEKLYLENDEKLEEFIAGY